MEMIRRELNRAREIPITYVNHAGSTIALFRADLYDAGVKHAIGRCLVAHAIDTRQINETTTGVIVHGAGNTVLAVKAGIDELGLDIEVIAVTYRETSGHIIERLKQQDIKVVNESPRIDGRGGRLDTVEQLCKTNLGYVPLEQHETEIIVDTQRKTFGARIAQEVTPTHFVAGVGTGGTLFGIGQALCDVNPRTKIIAIEGVGSTLTLWHAYLGAQNQDFDGQKRVIEKALEKYHVAGMLTNLECFPNNTPEEWFDIDLDFPDDIKGTVGIEGLGVGDPTQLIMNHVSMIDTCKIITDKQTHEGVDMLARHGINGFESAGANFYAAIQLAEKLRQQDRSGFITTIVTAKGKS